MTDEQKIKSKAYFEKFYREKCLPAYQAFIAHYPFTLADLDGEIWKWIIGYEGDYQMSNYGRAKTFKNGEVKIMKPTLTRQGYLRVNLYKNGACKTVRIHKIVAELFIPNTDNLPEINHEDGCKFNNHVDNLKWVTKSENLQHVLTMELRKMPQGTERPDAKFNDEQVKQLRDTYIPGDPEFGIRPLARKLGINRGTLQRLLRGTSYKNVK